jgi:hypothetical protein
METEQEFNKRVSRFVQQGLMMGGNIPTGELTSVEADWYKSFALLPHKTITNKWVWLQHIYQRHVRRCTGLIDEPFVEYATLFEMLQE